MPNGIAVRASPPLWIRSASSATDRDSVNTTACSTAVTARIPRLIETARTPARDRTIDGSTLPCVCPWSPWRWSWS